jgi:phage terminase Nu1 subunit (DNA packaging protein)
MTSNREDIIDPVVSAPVLAQWVGVTPKTIYEYAKIGVVVKAGKRTYWLRESITRCFEHIRRTASQRGGEVSLAAIRAERLRLTAGQADKVSIENAARRGELLDADAVERQWSDDYRMLSTGMLTVPAQCGQKLPHLTQADILVIDGEIRGKLAELGGGNGHDR